MSNSINRMKVFTTVLITQTIFVGLSYSLQSSKSSSPVVRDSDSDAIKLKLRNIPIGCSLIENIKRMVTDKLSGEVKLRFIRDGFTPSVQIDSNKDSGYSTGLLVREIDTMLKKQCNDGTLVRFILPVACTSEENQITEFIGNKLHEKAEVYVGWSEETIRTETIKSISKNELKEISTFVAELSEQFNCVSEESTTSKELTNTMVKVSPATGDPVKEPAADLTAHLSTHSSTQSAEITEADNKKAVESHEASPDEVIQSPIAPTSLTRTLASDLEDPTNNKKNAKINIHKTSKAEDDAQTADSISGDRGAKSNSDDTAPTQLLSAAKPPPSDEAETLEQNKFFNLEVGLPVSLLLVSMIVFLATDSVPFRLTFLAICTLITFASFIYLLVMKIQGDQPRGEVSLHLYNIPIGCGLVENLKSKVKAKRILYNFHDDDSGLRVETENEAIKNSLQKLIAADRNQAIKCFNAKEAYRLLVPKKCRDETKSIAMYIAQYTKNAPVEVFVDELKSHIDLDGNKKVPTTQRNDIRKKLESVFPQCYEIFDLNVYSVPIGCGFFDKIQDKVKSLADKKLIRYTVHKIDPEKGKINIINKTDPKMKHALNENVEEWKKKCNLGANGVRITAPLACSTEKDDMLNEVKIAISGIDVKLEFYSLQTDAIVIDLQGKELQVFKEKLSEKEKSFNLNGCSK